MPSSHKARLSQDKTVLAEEVDVVISEIRPRGKLMSWNGSGTIPLDSSRYNWISSPPLQIDLDDGRGGKILITRFGLEGAFEFQGSGPLE